MNFKEWCKEHGYTAKAIEELTGIPHKTIWDYWQGARTPTRAREKVLKDKLNMPAGLFDR